MIIEFYISGTNRRSLIESHSGELCPDVGEKISIRGETWKILSRSWALDYSGTRDQRMAVYLNCERCDDSLPNWDAE